MARRQREEVLRCFGEEVRRRRLRMGISQEGLAFRAGLDRTYVGSVERGERNVSLVNIVRLSDALGVRPAELLEALGTAERP